LGGQLVKLDRLLGYRDRFRIVFRELPVLRQVLPCSARYEFSRPLPQATLSGYSNAGCSNARFDQLTDSCVRQ
jgi:hypothetical protein